MLVENQQIEVKWVSANKKWYVDKGYEFTKMWDCFYVKAEDLMPTSKYKVRVDCDYCGKEYVCGFGDYNISIGRYGKVACYDCRVHKINATNMNNFAEDRYNSIKHRCDELNYTLLSAMEDITTVCMSMEFICHTHGHQTLHVDTFLHGAECRECARDKNKIKRMLSIQDRIEEEISQYNNNKLLNKEDYINSKTSNLKILCGSCDDVFITSRDSYFKNAKRNANYMCPNCNMKLFRESLLRDKDGVEEYINSINGNTLLNKYDYAGNDIHNLNIQCGGCGDIFVTSLVGYQAGKIMCDGCSSKISRGELAVKNVLDLYCINYNREYWFADCRDKYPLPFDFYLPDYNVCIEYQGEQHYKAISQFGGEEELEVRQYHDQIKRNYCNENNISLIEIPYWEYENIEQIITEKSGLHMPVENCV